MAIYESGHVVELESTKKQHVAASGEKRIDATKQCVYRYLEAKNPSTLRLSQQFGTVLGGDRLHFFDECGLFVFVELRRRRRASGNPNSNFHEEFLLPSRRTNTEHAYGLTGDVAKLMRSVGRDVQRFSGAEGRLRAAESGFHLAFEEDKGLFEVMAVRWRTPAGRDMHVDDAEASGSLLACNGDGVSISDQPEVREVVGLSKG